VPPWARRGSPAWIPEHGARDGNVCRWPPERLATFCRTISPCERREASVSAARSSIASRPNPDDRSRGPRGFDDVEVVAQREVLVDDLLPRTFACCGLAT
jgi:hypothetical protein